VIGDWGRRSSRTLSSAPSPSGPDWLGGSAESLGGTRPLSGLGWGARFIIICARERLAPYQLPVPLPRSCVVTVGLIHSIPAPKVLGNASNILRPMIFGRWILKARSRPCEPVVVIRWDCWTTIRVLLWLEKLAPISPPLRSKLACRASLLVTVCPAAFCAIMAALGDASAALRAIPSWESGCYAWESMCSMAGLSTPKPKLKRNASTAPSKSNCSTKLFPGSI
jgi:hypothetical protein